MTGRVRVVLAGVHGHGQWHVANLRRLAGEGLVDVVGVCDVRPALAEQLAGLGKPEQSADLAALIRRTRAEITILATPIHTHPELAAAALDAGSRLLLEKPPAPSWAGYERIAEAVGRTGLACQVGFQSLGSEAIPFVRKVIADGGIGRVRGIGVAGAWHRPARYFTRSPWAGRRRLDGVAVTDGALTNPFAHGLATALAVAEAEQLGAVSDIDVELYRANPIEADDTACARLRLASGLEITVAVTLCAPGRSEPYLTVHGEAGTARLVYTTDEVHIGQTVTRHARTDLLENLIAHVRDGAQLLVPLSRAAAFMQVVEAVRRAPEPTPIPEKHQQIRATGRVLTGVAELTDRSAERLALYSELDVPWAPAEQPLRVGAAEVARYRWRPELSPTVAPRPFLHPVRTLGGAVVSEAEPADHPHHLGVGVAIADVDGANFWGGRTFVPGAGPTWRADHGRQRHLRFARRTADGFVEQLEWLNPTGIAVLAEERRVAAVARTGGWALDFACTLTNLTEAPLTIRSSATKGREGAGYGGFFWRAPSSAGPWRVFTGDADGEEAVNGRPAPWVALCCPQWTLVFVQLGSADPWFVRAEQYPGVGAALAWREPLVLPGSLTRRVVTVVADGRLDRAHAAALATER